MTSAFYADDNQHCPEPVGENTTQAINLAWKYSDKNVKKPDAYMCAKGIKASFKKEKWNWRHQ